MRHVKAQVGLDLHTCCPQWRRFAEVAFDRCHASSREYAKLAAPTAATAPDGTALTDPTQPLLREVVVVMLVVIDQTAALAHQQAQQEEREQAAAAAREQQQKEEDEQKAAAAAEASEEVPAAAAAAKAEPVDATMTEAHPSAAAAAGM